MYYIVFCILAILIMSSIIGFRRGLFKTLFGFLALIITIGLTYVLNPIVTSYIIDNTEIDEYIENRVYSKLESDINRRVAESFKDSGVTTDLKALTAEETGRIMEENPDKATQIQLIEGLNLPKGIRNNIIENNNDEMYNTLGITTFYKYISSYAARLVVNALAFVGTLIAIRLILLLINIIGNIMIEEVEILKGVDRTGGLLLGLGVGFMIVWIFLIIANIAFGSAFDGMIEGNAILQKINDTNILMKILMNV
ncbi:MAG: CvpA family protein [Eubacterium sp.]|nr:CvpA family protein [Eubacterium sp.]